MTVALVLGWTWNISFMVIISWFSWSYVSVRNFRNAHGVDVDDDLRCLNVHTVRLQKWHKFQL